MVSVSRKISAFLSLTTVSSSTKNSSTSWLYFHGLHGEEKRRLKHPPRKNLFLTHPLKISETMWMDKLLYYIVPDLARPNKRLGKLPAKRGDRFDRLPQLSAHRPTSCIGNVRACLFGILLFFSFFSFAG